MHVIQHVPRRIRRRMNLPSERMVVNGNGLGSGERYAYATGLGELDGMFNIGKMFTRMFTFRPKSFTLKNIAGAVGSGTAFLATGGIANVAAEIAGPSGLKLTKTGLTSAHSKSMQYLGYGTMAAAAAAGVVFGGAALLPAAGAVGGGGVAATSAATTGAGFFGTVGSALSTVGSGLMTGLKFLGSALPVMGQVMGGGGGGQQQQQGGMTQEEYDAQQQAAYTQGQQQAAYDAQVRAQQEQMYQPNAAYGTGVPISYVPETGQPSMTGMNASYGDLRSPYTGVTQDGEQIQIDPRTGQVVQAGMLPDLSMTTWLVVGGVTLAGWYMLSGSKSESNN